MCLIYFVPEGSLYYRSESFSEMFIILENIKSGKDGFVLGDHNGRLGKLNFDNRCSQVNVVAVCTRENTSIPITISAHFAGDYTYIMVGKKSFRNR